jgi:hypothetical protein
MFAKEPDETQSMTDDKSANKKPAGKGAAKVEELSPEEEARLKEEKTRIETMNAENQTKWNDLSADEQFHIYAEDLKKKHKISFPVIPAENEGEEPSNTG